MNSRMKKPVTCGLRLFLILSSLTFQWFTLDFYLNTGFTHVFISNDNASSFLTLLEKVRIESLLVNNTMYSNLTSANDHVNQILGQIDDISDSENEYTVRSDQFDNSTVNALVFANIIDDVLKNYGATYGIPSAIMLNMSNLGSPAEMDSLNGTLPIIDGDKYETAYEYAKRASELFNITLRTYETKDNANATTQIGKGLDLLTDRIENKANPMELMMIVHTIIHPSMQMAYNLKLKTGCFSFSCNS